MKAKFFRIEIVAVFAALVIITCMLMLKPIIGVADNGDFGRIMGPSGLEYLSQDYNDRYFGYMTREYKIAFPDISTNGYFSTEVLLVELAKLMNLIFTFGKNIFDIRFLAFVYMCMFALAMYLIIKHTKQDSRLWNWLLAGLSLLVFTDAGYISYFNSLYGEAVSFSSLLLIIGLAFQLGKQKTPKISTLIAFFSGAIILTGAKAQNVPLGIILAVFGLRLLFLRKDFVWKKTVLFFCAVLLLTTVKAYTSIPDNIRVCNKYQSVFFGVLKDSPSPDRDLEELGIDNTLSVLANTNYFMKEYPINIKNPDLLNEISEKVSPFKVALFYAKHPLRYLEKLQVTAENSFKLIQGFGSYEKAENVPFGKVASSFRLWNDFKMNVLPHSLLFIAALFAAYFAVLLLKYRKAGSLSDKIHLEVFMLVAFIGLIQFFVPVVSDGEADLSKHLFLFNVCFDIMFVTTVLWLTSMLLKAIRKLLSKLLPGQILVNEGK